jgi:uncharacterized protein YecE (DUF72 family)
VKDGIHCIVPSADKVFVGTSGYNYPEWRGSFYPEKFPTTKMLPYYAERFRTVEINYTFYRIPNQKLLDGWASATPDGFSFTLKAPRRITHPRSETRHASLSAAAELQEGCGGATQLR